MRILKYIFLLLLLAFVALSVFVATQKGEFDIVQTKVINSPRPVLYNYVNDYRNWENWNSWTAEEKDAKFVYPAVTSGKGGSFSWETSDAEGSMQTIFTKENDSIAQKMIYNGSPSEVSWKFKDTVGGTKVTWRTKGRLDFMSKIYTVTKGGIERVMGDMHEKSLAKLDNTLDYEINTYSIKDNGIVQKPGTIYLKQTINSTFENMPKNMTIMLSKMMYFFKKNTIAANGKPFVIYHTYDTSKKQTRFSVCIPIREEIFTSAGSDILFGKMEPMQAVKVTLNGDYSHRKEAWDKAAQLLAKNKQERAGETRQIEVFTKGIEEIKSPSKWVTDIYIPVRTAATPKPAVQAVRPAANVPAAAPTQPE